MKFQRCVCWAAALCAGLTLYPQRLAAVMPEVTLTPLTDRVRVEIGGRLFTEYVFGDGARQPYCYPVLAADGTAMTRGFPMQKVRGEDRDHPWHRSLWFAHSSVNNVDFWNDKGGDTGHSPAAKGRIVQDSPAETRNGSVGMLHTHNRWLAPDGQVICSDDRFVRFQASGDDRIIDYEVQLHALPGAPLVLGDNKDGTMALRLAQWMAVSHPRTGTNELGAGHILTSTGARDAAAWGQRADWCDYYAPHNGKTYGVAIFDDPRNPRHPTWWQARDYGFLGANPFGQHDFENSPDQPHLGDFTVPPGGTLTLRYRIFLHFGDAKTADIAGRYAEYVAGN
jgi:hypothetical protein